MANFKIYPAEIGGRMRLLRKGQGKTQAKFASELGISPSYLALIEAGKRVASLEVLALVSKYCCVSVDFLLFGEENPDFDPLTQRLKAMVDSYPAAKVEHALRLGEYYLSMDKMAADEEAAKAAAGELVLPAGEEETDETADAGTDDYTKS